MSANERLASGLLFYPDWERCRMHSALTRHFGAAHLDHHLLRGLDLLSVLVPLGDDLRRGHRELKPLPPVRHGRQPGMVSQKLNLVTSTGWAKLNLVTHYEMGKIGFGHPAKW